MSAQLQYPAPFLFTNQWTECSEDPRTGVDTVAEERFATTLTTKPSLVIVLVSYC